MDRRQGTGLYILTGSATPPADARRHPRLALRILQSLARSIGMDCVVTRIAHDASSDDSDTARSTVYDYLAPLERLMVLDPVEAWSSHLRSRARLRTSPRAQFCDPSVAVAAVRTGPDQLLADLNYFGYLFEALVVRDLRVFANVVDGTVQHYRNSDGLEIDAVVTAGDTRRCHRFRPQQGSDEHSQQVLTSALPTEGKPPCEVDPCHPVLAEAEHCWSLLLRRCRASQSPSRVPVRRQPPRLELRPTFAC